LQEQKTGVGEAGSLWPLQAARTDAILHQWRREAPMNAKHVIENLGLEPHPEGGWYAETWRARAPQGQRAAGTAIYYLLEAGKVSHWHRIDATEIWHWYAGAALALTLSPDGGHGMETLILGPELPSGQRPQRIVPPGFWQTARSLGAWTLAGCTVSPGFEFAGFEMAPPDWHPGTSK
jgi:predicted cupin superfamily sugar epimerase